MKHAMTTESRYAGDPSAAVDDEEARYRAAAAP